MNKLLRCIPSALLLAASCSDALGLVPGELSGQCELDDNCAPDEICRKRFCLKLCSDDDDCQRSESCTNAACLPIGDRCLPGDKRCRDNVVPQVCTDKWQWEDAGKECTRGCIEGTCTRRPSCDYDQACGENGVSCCLSDNIEGGTFEKPYEVTDSPASLQVTVKPFALDRFEVTVSRFRSFLAEFGANTAPEEGDGRVDGVAASGWNVEWSSDPTLVSPNASSLRISLRDCGVNLDPEELDLPMTCVSWYLAQEFCIWDGGRLPTEAEWTFAAMGGDEERPYPWSQPTFDASIDESRACFDAPGDLCPAPVPVGSFPRGKGRWETRDLAGNVSEWVADVWQADLSQASCDAGSSEPDPAGTRSSCKTEDSPDLRSVKGGSFALTSQFLLNTTRSNALAARKNGSMGLRCVPTLDR